MTRNSARGTFFLRRETWAKLMRTLPTVFRNGLFQLGDLDLLSDYCETRALTLVSARERRQGVPFLPGARTFCHLPITGFLGLWEVSPTTCKRILCASDARAERFSNSPNVNSEGTNFSFGLWTFSGHAGLHSRSAAAQSGGGCGSTALPNPASGPWRA